MLCCCWICYYYGFSYTLILRVFQYLQYNVLILRCFSATVSQKSERLCQSFQVKTKLFMFSYIHVRIQHVLASCDDIFSLYYVNIR